jgi:hypothetical protein
VQSSSKVDAVVVSAATVILCGLVARLAFLAADPTYPFWSGWVTDEGRWVHTARNIVLFGAPSLDSALARTHLILGPAYQALSTAVFWVLGVGSVQARLLSVASGLGILLVAGLFLRRRLPHRVTLAALALLAVQPDLVYFSRVAIPEMTALFFELGAFILLVGGPRTRRKAFFGGIVTAVALGVKGTTAPIVLGFAVVVLLVHRPTDPGSRLSRLLAFLAAIVLPAVGFVALISLKYPGRGGFQDILGFVDLNTAYGVVATLFEGGWTVHVNLMLMAVWGIGLISWIRRVPEGEARAIFIGSSVWIATWILLWAALLYFPERYVMHIHLPLVLALASGYALLADERGAPLGVALDDMAGARRAAMAVLLAVPAAVVTSPLVFSAIDVVGPTLDNLRFHLVAIAGLSIILGFVLLTRWRESWVVGVGLGYPLAAAALWTVGRAAGWVPVPYWSIDGARTGPMWAIILASAVAATVGLTRLGATGALRPPRFVAVFATVLALLWAGQGVTKFEGRRFVLREVTDYLVENYPDAQRVGSRSAGSVLLSTPFAYRELSQWEDWPELVVVYWIDEYESLLGEYQLVREFDLDVGPGFTDTYRSRHVIRVYERRPDDPGLQPGF